jgi:hypothetical protein
MSDGVGKFLVQMKRVTENKKRQDVWMTALLPSNKGWLPKCFLSLWYFNLQMNKDNTQPLFYSKTLFFLFFFFLLSGLEKQKSTNDKEIRDDLIVQ